MMFVAPLAIAFHACPTAALMAVDVLKHVEAVAVPVMMIPGPPGWTGVIGAGAMATTLVLPGVQIVKARRLGFAPII